jgi:dTDP-4-dehydrorhamnose reductase
MKRVLVTGSNGQLGLCIQELSKTISGHDFVFTTSKELDITDAKAVTEFFSAGHYDFCINCAAYTNVEKAEKFPGLAFEINAEAVKNLSVSCKEFNIVLIHISTDYVFDGTKKTPYTVKDIPNPINEYGRSKLLGEHYIQRFLNRYILIRTSWLYSDYGHNFYRTIVEKSKTEKELYITDEQIGCPTNAMNLAGFILGLLSKPTLNYGLYHFTDGEAMTWFDFADKILIEKGLRNKVELVRDRKYRTFAKRPKNSVLI